MKKAILILILSLSFTIISCGKKSELVNETPETIETDSESSLAEQTEDNLEDTTTTESNTNVDSTGVDVQLSEDEYQGTRPEDEEVSEEAVEDVAANTGVAMTENEALADIQNMLDQGLISETEYQELLELIEDVYSPKPTQSTQTPGYSQQQLTPEQQAAADAMITTGKDNEHRTNMTYDDVDLPDHLKGDFIN